MLDPSLETSAKIENGVAFGLIGVGAATVVVGSVLLYVNRGRTVYDLAPVNKGVVVSVRGGF
jgi:hypothetical protein